AGVRTTAASRHWTDRVPSADAEVVRRLREACAIIVGKTKMDEFVQLHRRNERFRPVLEPTEPQALTGRKFGWVGRRGRDRYVHCCARF
ncbi:MAG TPA: amidase family protein, partial [Bryobacteraceae bacterium]|nr:amidase family protein [Bryobacteraceae bacterium]